MYYTPIPLQVFTSFVIYQLNLKGLNILHVLSLGT